jgi:DNA-binding XRE family transcriptional regulator
MSEELSKTQQVNNLIRLLRSGDAKSLLQLRNLLAIDSYDLANQIGVSEQALEQWENGDEQPLGLHYALWKIKLSSYIDERISISLGTNDSEITSKYWALVWDLAA